MDSVSDEYFSIGGESTASYREKASKFLAFAYPVTSADEVKRCLEALKKLHFDANHHCYAYRIGHENEQYRVNDDGEPSGSAGRPIYGQILSRGLTDVLVVVVRYFGGTKLGVPGLINAYKTAAREALANAEIITKTVTVHLVVRFEYEMMNQVMRIIKEESAKVTRQTMGESCELLIASKKSSVEKIEQRLLKLRKVEVTF